MAEEKWRPDGWIEKRNHYLNFNTLLCISMENKATYEAGADAILESEEVKELFEFWRLMHPQPTEQELKVDYVKYYKEHVIE